MAWEVKKLGALCDIQNGYAFNSKKFSFEKGQPLIRIRDLKNGRFTETRYNGPYDEKYVVRKGDYLIGMDGEFRCFEWLGKDSLLNQRVCKLQNFSDNFDRKFLFYCINSYLKAIEDVTSFTTVKHLSSRQIFNIELPIPSLSIQKQIVTILDKAFEKIAKAKENTEQNLKNAKEVFESYLQSVFENKGEGWEEKQLQDMCERITKGSSPKWQGIKYVEKPGVMFITSENVGKNEMIYDKIKYVQEAFNIKDSKSILKEGDVLTNIVGASIGRTAIFNRNAIANINQAVCMLRCHSNKILNQYLSFMLNSPFLVNHLHDNEVDNARANLSLTFFRELIIPVPPLSEQNQIVTKIEEMSAKTKKLESIDSQKLSNLEELKQSILQKAFKGELTKEVLA